MTIAPMFIQSPFFVPEPDNWHLLPDAPQEVVNEFNTYMAEQKVAEEQGVAL